jgi:hypothetical protein
LGLGAGRAAILVLALVILACIERLRDGCPTKQCSNPSNLYPLLHSCNVTATPASACRWSLPYSMDTDRCDSSLCELEGTYAKIVVTYYRPARAVRARARHMFELVHAQCSCACMRRGRFLREGPWVHAQSVHALVRWRACVSLHRRTPSPMGNYCQWVGATSPCMHGI